MWAAELLGELEGWEGSVQSFVEHVREAHVDRMIRSRAGSGAYRQQVEFLASQRIAAAFTSLSQFGVHVGRV
jgi:hypothetical protein